MKLSFPRNLYRMETNVDAGNLLVFYFDSILSPLSLIDVGNLLRLIDSECTSRKKFISEILDTVNKVPFMQNSKKPNCVNCSLL